MTVHLSRSTSRLGSGIILGIDINWGMSMDYALPYVYQETCEKCSRSVCVTVSSNATNLQAPKQKSECIVADCPINVKNRPGAIQIIEISFIQDEA